MTQAPLSFQYNGTQNGNFTALAGLPIFSEMAYANGQSGRRMRNNIYFIPAQIPQ